MNMPNPFEGFLQGISGTLEGAVQGKESQIKQKMYMDELQRAYKKEARESVEFEKQMKVRQAQALADLIRARVGNPQEVMGGQSPQIIPKEKELTPEEKAYQSTIGDIKAKKQMGVPTGTTKQPTLRELLGTMPEDLTEQQYRSLISSGYTFDTEKNVWTKGETKTPRQQIGEIIIKERQQEYPRPDVGVMKDFGMYGTPQQQATADTMMAEGVNKRFNIPIPNALAITQKIKAFPSAQIFRKSALYKEYKNRFKDIDRLIDFIFGEEVQPTGINE